MPSYVTGLAPAPASTGHRALGIVLEHNIPNTQERPLPGPLSAIPGIILLGAPLCTMHCFYLAVLIKPRTRAVLRAPLLRFCFYSKQQAAVHHDDGHVPRHKLGEDSRFFALLGSAPQELNTVRPEAKLKCWKLHARNPNRCFITHLLSRHSIRE
jgi:hypothetical protein